MLRVFLECGDQYFVNAFNNYVTNHCRDIELMCFTDFEKASSFIQKTALRFNVVICDEDFKQVGGGV